MKKGRKRALLAVVTAALAVGCIAGVASVATAASTVPVPDDRTLTAQKSQTIAPGFEVTEFTTVNAALQQNMYYYATIDMSNPTVGFLAGYSNYDDSGKWNLVTVRDQAKAAEKKTGKKIVFAVNGDYFNMNTGEPLGLLIMNGKVVHEGSEPAYFGVTKSGEFVIRHTSEGWSDMQQAVGSPNFLVENGEVVLGDDGSLIPVVSIGMTADNKLIVLEIDGRQAKSAGMSLGELAKQMKALGCVTAIYIDGGGSATFCAKPEGETDLKVFNSPSDSTERSVSSSYLFYSDAKGSGVCTHAAVSPDSEAYMPGSTIQFSAKGADDAYGPAELPSDCKFAFAGDGSEYGTLSESGEFVSNGKQGSVTVQVVSSDPNFKSENSQATIEIVAPDKISFAESEVSLGFGKESDLGLSVTYQQRRINYDTVPLTWTQETYTDAARTVPAAEGVTLGTFNGNIFTAADDTTLYGYITCGFGDVTSDKLVVACGLAPTVVMSFEDYEPEGEEKISAKDYWTFDKALFNASGGTVEYIRNADGSYTAGNETLATKRMITGSYHDGGAPRDGVESAEIVSSSDGYEPRKGTYCLKLNYDFSNSHGIEGACFGFAETQTIPGSPTSLGVWVYAPEGAANLWLRCRLVNGDGSMVPIDFTGQGKATPDPNAPSYTSAAHAGVDWEGWMYLEADLTTVKAPYTLLAGENFRVMYSTATHGSGNKIGATGEELPQSEAKGYLLIDDFSFVYGSNPEDVNNPIVKDILANNESLVEDATLHTNTVNFTINAVDDPGKGNKGVLYDPAATNVLLDGVDITAQEIEAGNYLADKSKDSFFLYNQHLSNGDHSLSITVRDENNNKATKTVNFSVEGDEVAPAKVAVSASASEAVIGSTIDVVAKADHRELVSSFDATIKVTPSDFAEYVVTYGEGYKEAAAPVYSKSDNTVKVSAVKTEGAEVADEGAIVTLSYKVPTSMVDGSTFNYAVTSGKFTTKDGDLYVMKTFVQKTKKLPVVAQYVLSVTPAIAGYEFKVSVTDRNGEPVRGAQIFNVSTDPEVADELLGKTDRSGGKTLVADEAQAFTLYAVGSDGLPSFKVKFQSFNPGAGDSAAPMYVKLNAASDGFTAKNVTWISNPDAAKKAAIVQYATQAAYDADGASAFQNAAGACELLSFNGGTVADNRIVYNNTVDLTGLTPGTEYVYRVGDGQVWSDVNTFRTSYKGENTKFFIVGDTQAEDTTTITNIVKAIGENDFTFGAQLGDFVETASLYAYWDQILKAFDNPAVAGTDMIHVTGNHELMAADAGKNAKALFNNDPQHYSVTYGNVYVAVIGYADERGLCEANAEWLIKDAAQSNATWKIVLSHQPVYFTNELDNTTDLTNRIMAPAYNEAGIDFVFSGHNHAYTRSVPMVSGEPNANNYYVGQPDENGTVFFICGSTGEKEYAVSNNNGFNWAKETSEGQALPTNDFDGLYLTVDATDTAFTVIAHEQDGSVFDTYTKTKETCPNGLHEYVAGADGHLVCSKCGTSRTIEGYSGNAIDQETGLLVSYNNGTRATNQWIPRGEDFYYVGADGVAVTGVQTIDGLEYTFDENGVCIHGSFVTEDVTTDTGEVKTYTRYYEGGGTYAKGWREIDGYTYCFSKSAGNMYKGKSAEGTHVTVTSVFNQSTEYTRVYVFDDQGHLLVGAFDQENGGTRYYWANEYAKNETITVDGLDYTFDAEGMLQMRDLSQCEFGKIANRCYTGKEIRTGANVTYNGVKLKSGTYGNYTTSYKNNIKTGKASITITGNPTYGFTGSKTLNFMITKAPGTKFTSNGIKYEVSKGGADARVWVYGTTITSGKVTIPAAAKDGYGISYKVTYVKPKAFYHKTGITSVYIGKNVSSIGRSAFSGDTGIKTVTFGEGSNLKSICAYAFYGCKNLTSFTFPSNVTKIGLKSLKTCGKLKTITIKSTKLTKSSIWTEAFAKTYPTVTVKVPASKLTAYKSYLKTAKLPAKAKIVKIS